MIVDELEGLVSMPSINFSLLLGSNEIDVVMGISFASV